MVCTRWIPVVGFALTAVVLSGCGGIKEDLGLAKKAPDEFAVVKRPPLDMPPDFALRPPRPGERGPQSAEMRDQARESLIGSASDRGVSVAAAPAGSVAQDPLAGTGFAVAGSAPAAGSTASPAPAGGRGGPSYGEMALLDKAGVNEANPQIRQLVDQESAQIVASENTLVDQLMFWRDRPPAGEVVDAPAETRRLRENAALGRPATEGNTPTIERKAQGRGISLF